MIRTIRTEDGPGLSPGDRGLAYGDGLFETLRVRGEKPALLDRHLARLLMGARHLGIPLNRQELSDTVDQAIGHYGRSSDWVLKIIVTRGTGGRGYRPPQKAEPCLIVSAHDLPALPDPTGVSACLSPHTVAVGPGTAGLKTISRIDQVLAARDMAPGCYESILTDLSGRLVEGTRTNLLMGYRDQWLVPPGRSLAVAGVMVDRVAEYLRSSGQTVRERPLAPSMLTDGGCHGLLLLNSVIGAVPVRKLGCVRLPVDPRLATICGESLLME